MSSKKLSLPQYTKRYEYTKIDPDVKFSAPPNGSQQELRNGVRFQLNDRTGVYDWSQAYFSLNYHVEKLADGTAVSDANDVNVQCGSHSFIRRLVLYAQNNDTVYECSEVNKAVFVKKLLTQSRDYAETIGEDEFWYLDTSTTVDTSPNGEVRKNLLANKAVQDLKIPLRNYSVFESMDFNNILLSGMQITIVCDIEQDANLIFRLDFPAEPVRVVIDKMELWTPLVVLHNQHQDEYKKSITAGQHLNWTYLREVVRYQAATTASNGSFRITGIVNPRKVIYYFILDNQEGDVLSNNQHFDSMFDVGNGIGGDQILTSARAELGADNVFYPRSDYQNNQLSRLYGDTVKYAHIDGSQQDAGLQLSRTLYRDMYSMLYFDFDYKERGMVTDTTDIVLHYTLSGITASAYRIYAVIQFENEAKFGQIGGDFVITSSNTRNN